ncbi:MAG: peptidoglycan DD-metalloendopeptidase family protein [Synergistaceae bacterium]|nr:peptidoglycan DD-metalloendopeptidase family protein [Synergistaceae bacterium]
MRSDRERMRESYPYQYQNTRGRDNYRKGKHAGVSLGFCWGFGLIVCATFGLASFLMFSAGHFDISPGNGVGTAWGGSNQDENFTSTRSIVQVEVTELDGNDDVPENASLYAEARNNMMEEFGPFPKYLSDYESIMLSVHEDGTNIPVNDDDEEEPEEIIEVKTPAAAEEPVLTETGKAWREHVVKSGETLSDIALAYGSITAQDILKANGLKDANRLSENLLLLIPNDPSKVEDTLDEVSARRMRIAATKEVVEPIRTKNYVVSQGDSLWSIANTQNVELDTLVGSNSFKTSARLRPGVVLRIPNQDGIFYVMKNGDTIESVSRRYGVSMNKIRQVNADINVALLKTGDEVFLPGARPEGLVENKDVKTADTKKPSPAKPAPKTAAKPVPKAEKPAAGEVAVRKAKGGLRWPIMGRINSPFGWRQHPITKRKDFHTGIDIKANRNDPIKAAGSGKVLYSGWMGGYGKVLVIEHPNGQSTLYAHCSTLLAGKGASVASGQLVAKIGTTGRSTGPHLHFEVRNGNSPVNPIKYLSR